MSGSSRAIPPRISDADPVRRLAVWLGLLAAAGCLVVYFFPPGHYGFYPVCQFHALTGLNCPGCGMLRATHLLLHGEVLAALRHNALLVAGLPLAGALFLWRWARGATLNDLAASPAWVWWAGAMILVFGVLRNLPLAPFAWFSP